MRIEVAWAQPDRQVIVPLEVRAGTTVEQAIQVSGLLQRFPEIDLTQNRVGIFSHLVSLEHVPEEGDRIEIYRPLVADPKEVRRQRAALEGRPHGAK